MNNNSNASHRELPSDHKRGGIPTTPRESGRKAIWVRLCENQVFIGVTTVDVVADGRITIARICDAARVRCPDLLENAHSLRLYSGRDEEVYLPGHLIWHSRTHGGSRKELGLILQFTTPQTPKSEIHKVTQARLQRVIHQMDEQHAQMLETQRLIRELRDEMHLHWDQLLQRQDAMFQNTHTHWEELLQSQTAFSQNTQTQLAMIIERQNQILQIEPQLQERMDRLKAETEEQMQELRQLCIIQLTHH